MATFTVGTADTYFNGVTEGVSPGDTIKVTQSAGRDWLTFAQVVGTALAPITIVNDGGRVVFDVGSSSRMYCVQFDECDYVVFRGDGHAHEYGFQCIEYSNCGVWAHNETEHFEMCNVEIGATKAGAGTGAGAGRGVSAAGGATVAESSGPSPPGASRKALGRTSERGARKKSAPNTSPSVRGKRVLYTASPFSGSIFTTARSVRGSPPTSLASYVYPVKVVTVNSSAFSITWLLVRM